MMKETSVRTLILLTILGVTPRHSSANPATQPSAYNTTERAPIDDMLNETSSNIGNAIYEKVLDIHLHDNISSPTAHDHNISNIIANDHNVSSPTTKDHNISSSPANDHITSSLTANDHIASSSPVNDHITSSPTANDHIASSPTANDHITSSTTANDPNISSPIAKDHITSSTTANDRNISSPMVNTNILTLNWLRMNMLISHFDKRLFNLESDISKLPRDLVVHSQNILGKYIAIVRSILEKAANLQMSICILIIDIYDSNKVSELLLKRSAEEFVEKSKIVNGILEKAREYLSSFIDVTDHMIGDENLITEISLISKWQIILEAAILDNEDISVDDLEFFIKGITGRLINLKDISAEYWGIKYFASNH